MATLEELERALRNAHAAGDEQAARAFAGEIRSMRNQSAQSSFQDLPWWAKVGRAADDAARIFANSVTLGYADKLAGAMGGGTAEERAKTQDAVARAGSASIPLELLGLLVPGGAASRSVGTVLRGSGLPTTMVREGVAGAMVGAGSALGHDENVGDGVLSGAMGGMAGGAAGKYIGEGIDAIATRAGNIMPGVLSSIRTPRQSLDEMRAATERAYDAVDAAGINYAPQQIKELTRNITERLRAADIDPELHKAATRRSRKMRSRMGRRSVKPTSLKEIDRQRQLISRDVRGSAGENEMGRIMRQTLDEFVEKTPPRNASSSEANRLIREAREMARRTKVRSDIEDTLELARNSAAGEGNVAPFRSLLNRGTKGMTKEEAAALRRIVRGEGIEQEIINKMSGMAGKIGTVGSAATAGALLGGPHMASAMGIASFFLPEVLRSGARRFTQKNIEELLDIVGGAKFDEAALREALRHSGGVAGGVAAGDQQRRQREARRKVRRRD